MKIVFKKLRYKNILSTGNTFTEIQLDRRSTTLISGTNGSGKSTVLDAIVFALYGKAFRKINKNQLINSINSRELHVEVEFTISQNQYMVRRGIKPNIFEIYRNGELINQDAAARDYQAYLEQNILNLNYKSFNQIVVLGSATYVPFMELPAHTRREIIEDLLDMQSENSYSRDLTESKIESAEAHNASIRKIRQDEVDKIKEKMGEHISKIESEKAAIETIQDIIEVCVSDIQDKADIKQKLEKAKGIHRDLRNSLRKVHDDLSFYNNHDNCPTCQQGIAHDFKENVIKEKDEKIVEIETGLTALAEKITEYETRMESISSIEDQIASANVKISEHRATIKISKNALVSYKSELDKAEEEVEAIDQSALNKLKEKMANLNGDQERLFEDKEVLSVVSTILRDGGIKSKIIAQYIPVMNKLINKYLTAFDLFVDFQLDENFNEQIKSRFRDAFSYASFSEGEKLRITLSIMLAWRTVAKLRNSVSTNLLILDETLDGALDGVGIDNLIDTLHNLNADDNIFVISHRGDQFGEKFHSHIRFQKVKNFSEMAA
jgi:DNA repair exonuclease SbcCD ATPase subunit